MCPSSGCLVVVACWNLRWAITTHTKVCLTCAGLRQIDGSYCALQASRNSRRRLDILLCFEQALEGGATFLTFTLPAQHPTQCSRRRAPERGRLPGKHSVTQDRLKLWQMGGGPGVSCCVYAPRVGAALRQPWKTWRVDVRRRRRRPPDERAASESHGDCSGAMGQHQHFSALGREVLVRCARRASYWYTQLRLAVIQSTEVAM